jgi:hypothetical protein
VKKLDEGQTVVCYVCHKEGHKSYECNVKNGGGAKKKEKQKANKQAFQHLHQQGEQGLHTLSLLKKKNDKVVAIKVNKQANNGAKRIWVSKEIISNMKSTKKVWIPKEN